MARLLVAFCAVLLTTTAYAADEENFLIEVKINASEFTPARNISLYFAEEGSYLSTTCSLYTFVCCISGEYEYESYDGWYNNPAHPDWGGAGRRI